MMTKRLIKKHLRKAIEITCQIVAQVIEKEVDEEERLHFVAEGETFFKGRKSRHIFLRLAHDMHLVYSSKSPDTFRFLIEMDFSAARRRFGEMREVWQKEAPPHIQSSFNLVWFAMGKEMFLASEDE